MAVTKAQVAQLYVALFNRAPEGAGLNAWVSAGVFRDQAQTADAMLQSPAIAAYFNGRIDSNLGYIENIYKNILGKDYSQDPDGINAWVRHLELGHSRGETLVTLFQVARSPEAIAADPTAAAVFANKTAIAAYMAEKITDIESDGSGNFNYAPFQDIIATTNSTNLEEQKAKIDQLAAEAAAGSKTFTTGLDNFLGTDGDDTFNGIYYAGGGAKTSTLSSLDTLDARGGKDTLNLTVLKNGADKVEITDLDTAMNGISNIENLNIKSEVKFDPAVVTINKGLDNLSVQTIDNITLTTDTKEVVAVNTTGVVTLTAAEATKEVVAKSSAGSVTVNAAKLEGKVSIDAGAGADLTAAKAQEVVIKAKGNTNIADASKAKKLDIDLHDKANTLTIATAHPLAEATDVTLSSLKLASATALAKATKISVTDVDFATFNISTDVENVDFSMNYKFKEGSTDAQLTAALAAANATNLTLHAKADKKAFFTYSGANDKLVKAVIDGDAKNLTADFSAQTKLANIDASAFTGNFEKLTVGNVANSTVRLGSGNDTVELTATANKQTIDGGAGADLVSVTSAIAFAGAGDNVTLTNFEGLQISNALANDVDMSKWGAFNNVTLVQGVSAGGKLQKLLNNSTITIDTVTLSNDLVVGIKDAATGTADKVNFVLNPKGTTTGLTGKFVVDDIENIDIASNLDDKKTATAKNTIELKASAAKDTLTNVVIKGEAATKLTLDATITKVKTVDASMLKGNFTFDASGHLDEKSAIKGGAGDDTITFGSKSSVTVTGGAGKDTFVLGTVGDSAAFPASKTATITDFSKGDKLKIGANLTGTIDQNIARYDSTKSLDFANNLSRALDVATAASNKLAYFTYTDPDSNATDTYLVRSDTSAGLSANDYVVKLTGIVDLAGATLADAGTNLELTL